MTLEGNATIALPPGFDAGPAWRYHARDALRAPDAPAERLDAGMLTKALMLDGQPRLLTLAVRDTPDGPALHVGLDAGPSNTASHAALESALRVARRMLGLTPAMDAAVAGLAARAREDADTARLVGDRLAFRPPLTASVFEALVWAIIGQQINLTFAADLRRQLILLAGRPHVSGMVAHPDAAAVAALAPEDLTARRFSRAKAAYLIGAARAVAQGGLDLEGLAAGGGDDAAAEQALCALRGIGPWTANYVLLRGCGLVDRVPVGDAGLAAALSRFHGLERRPDAAAQARLMQPFAPWRGLATAHLWAGWS